VLALEITWVRGTAIVQTLFTCLYCHCPDDVTSEPLKLYLQALLKGCDATKRAVSKASVYEEEDFSVNMGGHAFCDGVSDEEITARFSALEDSLQRALKEARARAGEGDAAAADEARWTEGLIARMVLRKAYYATIGHLSKGLKGLRAARKSIAYALAQLPAVAASRAYDASRVARVAFQPELNMKLMAPSPPRAVNILCVDVRPRRAATASARPAPEAPGRLLLLARLRARASSWNWFPSR
jgi:hypothetical protein